MNMNTLRLTLLSIFCITTFTLSAQNNNPTVMILGKDSISLSKFLNSYTKNNDIKTATKADLDSYIDLYVNFQLKYQEALMLRLDTIAQLQAELAGYREQAAVQYLTDKEVSDKILNEAIEHSKWDIRASHILKKVSLEALPADTLTAYKEIMNIRNRILKGEDFAKIAEKESDDPSAQDQYSAGGELIRYGNHGDLGYFTAFDMIYSFEKGAYETPVGSISMPIRSEFGYHLIYVVDKKPALGKIQASQIMLPFNRNINLSEAERQADINQTTNKINQIYTELKNGLSFEDALTKYMDGNNGAKLPTFTCNRFDGNFISALYGLKEGEYSKPVKTLYGWHIIKITKIIPIEFNEETIATIKSKVTRDSRSNKSKDSFIERVKKENNFKEIALKKNERKPIEDFYTALDNSIFQGNFRAEMTSNLNRIMFSMGGKNYTQQNFANYLERHPFTNLDTNLIIPLVNFAYKNFIAEEAIKLEDSQLEIKYPEFAQLMREYKEGVLLYELNEIKVWRKAEEDSVGLENYYQSVKNNYLYPIRTEALRVKCVDEKTSTKVQKMLPKVDAIALANKVNKKSVTSVIDTVIYIDFRPICSCDNPQINQVFLKKEDNEVYKVLNILQQSPKPFSEVKGVIIAGYQQYLEKQWIEDLHKQNTIWIDREAIYNLIK